MISYNEFFENFSKLQKRIDEAACRFGRDASEIALLPVTKNHPAEVVRFCLQAGLSRVGENRVQEASGKVAELDLQDVSWDLIGHLQTNKAKVAVQTFHRLQSLDSLRLAKKLDRLLEESDDKMSCFVQVNTGEDPGKYGFTVEGLKKDFAALLDMENLKIEGLMTIAPLEGGSDSAREAFARLRILRDDLLVSFGQFLPHLSMGMSGDLEEAIQEGSTIVRVGSDLFGSRD